MSVSFPLLAFEGSSTHLSLALFRSPDNFSVCQLPPDGLSHSQKIVGMLDSFLAEQKVSLNEIASLAAPSGPGSFTSLRIVLATLMGISDVFQIPIYTCSSLAALALTAGEGFQAPFLKAGRGQIYCAAYEVKSKKVKTCIPETVLMPDEYVSQIKKEYPQAFFCGPDATMLGSEAVKVLAPMAWAVGHLVIENPVRLDSQNLHINYLKEPDIG